MQAAHLEFRMLYGPYTVGGGASVALCVIVFKLKLEKPKCFHKLQTVIVCSKSVIERSTDFTLFLKNRAISTW